MLEITRYFNELYNVVLEHRKIEMENICQ